MPTMGRLKLSAVVPAGGVSKIVMVTLALPLLLQFVWQVLFGPLQEASARAAIAARSSKELFQVIEHPMARNNRQRAGLPGIPPQHCSPEARGRGQGKERECPSINGRGGVPASRAASGACGIVQRTHKGEVEAASGEA